MKHLFVGGCADGQWIESVGDTFQVEGHKYRQSRIDTIDDVILIYCWVDAPQGSILDRLLAGYHPGEALTGLVSGDSAYPGIRVNIDQPDVKRLIERGAFGKPVTVVFQMP